MEARVIPSSIRASLCKRSTCRKKNYLYPPPLPSPLWNALAESRGYPASVVPIKITRGKNLSIKPIATCKDRSSVTLRDHTRTHTHERTHIHARSLPSFRVMIFNRRQHRRVAVPFLAREGRGGKKRSILFHSC